MTPTILPPTQGRFPHLDKLGHRFISVNGAILPRVTIRNPGRRIVVNVLSSGFGNDVTLITPNPIHRTIGQETSPKGSYSGLNIRWGILGLNDDRGIDTKGIDSLGTDQGRNGCIYRSLVGCPRISRILKIS